MDRTEDEIFNEHLQNFSKQQNSANKLQKEFNNYIRCVRGKFPTNSTCIYIVAGFFFWLHRGLGQFDNDLNFIQAHVVLLLVGKMIDTQ